MQITGELPIGGPGTAGGGAEIAATSPASGEAQAPVFRGVISRLGGQCKKANREKSIQRFTILNSVISSSFGNEEAKSEAAIPAS